MNRNDDNLKAIVFPSHCVCGSPARIRYRIPCTWVECRRKCGMRTGYFTDREEQPDPDATEQAVKAWNRMVDKGGKNQ